MHIHLDPLGGISGDMFISAILDRWPAYADDFPKILNDLKLADKVSIDFKTHIASSIKGSQFSVDKLQDFHHHTSYSNIKKLLSSSGLSKNVIARSIDIFYKLACAEARVHDCKPEDVTFHEVGAWDSIVDIVFSAYLIDAIAVESWSISPIPSGYGRIECQHGVIPIPAPATHFLLKDFVMFNDGISGERVTPTGAAIVSHLEPSFNWPNRPFRLISSGIGFGKKTFEGIPNILRISELSPVIDDFQEEISIINFEIDDQTPEDLAIGIERLRSMDAIIDVIQSSVIGKKGRHAIQIQILCRPEDEDMVIDSCFAETTTIGVRYQRSFRKTLNRAEFFHEGIKVKTVNRNGENTAKADIDDVLDKTTSHSSRAKTRAKAEQEILNLLHGENNGAK